MANVEASSGDYHYIKYKRELEGTQCSKLSNNLPIVGVAIFGLGRIGTIHLGNLRSNPKCQIVYCVEEITERCEQVRNQWKLFEPATTFLKPDQQDIVFKDPRVTAVLICSPTLTHEPLILKALESNKAVFCEKPLAVDEEGIERCIKAAKKHSKPLMCAFNRRFDPSLRVIKQRIDSDTVGKVHVIKTCSRDSPKPSIDFLKISGGFFHDCAVHDIDLVCWMLGEYPESVTSFAHVNCPEIAALDDYDTVLINMKFPSGALASIDLSREAVYGYDQRVEVFGPKGMLTNGEMRPSGVKCHDGKGTTAVPILFSFASRYKESYFNEIDHFLDVVQGLEECEVKVESILAAYKVATACEKAAKTGQIVKLDLN